MPNIIAKIIDQQKVKKEKIKQQKLKKEEALELFRERVRFRTSPRDSYERGRITKSLLEKGVTARVCRDLTLEIAKSDKVFLEWEKKSCKYRDGMTMEDVVPITSFSKLLITLRELYASDIAEEISYNDAATVAIEDVLFRPFK